MQRLPIVVLVAILLVVAPAAGVATVDQATTPTSSVQSASEYDGVFETANDNVSVWERTPFPLRADATTGATVVENQILVIDHWDEDKGDAQARYDHLAVFDADQEIPIAFDDTTVADIDQFQGLDASVIVGKLDPSTNTSEALSSVPTSVAEFQELFAEDRLDDVNANATFVEIDTQTVDADGFETTFTPTDEAAFGDGVGQYVVLVTVADESPGMTVASGDLDPQGHSIVVGVEALVTQTGASSVSVDGVEPGDAVTFDVDAGIGDAGTVQHAVVLYHEETFTSATTTFNLTAKPSTNSSADDLIVESEIGAVNGVADIDSGDSLLSDLLGDVAISGTVNVADVIALADGAFDEAVPEFEGGDTTLDASTTSFVAADPSAEITVETFGNWTEGDYRWIHVATDGSALATAGDTITIEEDTSSPGPPAPPAPPAPTHDFDLVDSSLPATDVLAGESFVVSATFENVGDDAGTETIELRRDGAIVDETDLSLAVGETDTVSFTQTVDEPGTYGYAVDGTVLGTVTVVGPSPSFETRDASLSERDVSTGDTVDVSAVVENAGDVAGTHTAQLVIDGEVVDETDVSLDPGETETVTFSHTFEDPGNYNVFVDDARAGTVSVSADDDGLPGFGPLAAIVALAATLLAVRVRNR